MDANNSATIPLFPNAVCSVWNTSSDQRTHIPVRTAVVAIAVDSVKWFPITFRSVLGGDSDME